MLKSIDIVDNQSNKTTLNLNDKDFETLKVALGEDLFSVDDLDNMEKVLTEILISDISKNVLAGKHSAINIGHQLGTVTLILDFLRKFPIVLNGIDISNDPKLQEIKNHIEKIDYDEVSKLLFRGLNEWIYQDEDYENACISYIATISYHYNAALKVLDSCNYYFKHMLEIETSKGGVSCN